MLWNTSYVPGVASCVLSAKMKKHLSDLSEMAFRLGRALGEEVTLGPVVGAVGGAELCQRPGACHPAGGT